MVMKFSSKDVGLQKTKPASKLPDIVIDCSLLLEEDSFDTSSQHSSVTNSSILSSRRGPQRLLDIETPLSLVSSEIARMDAAQNDFINKLFSRLHKKTKKKNEKARAKLMQGRSMYGFPSLEVFQTIHENQVLEDVENETVRLFGSGSAQYGLAMVSHEKADVV